MGNNVNIDSKDLGVLIDALMLYVSTNEKKPSRKDAVARANMLAVSLPACSTMTFSDEPKLMQAIGALKALLSGGAGVVDVAKLRGPLGLIFVAAARDPVSALNETELRRAYLEYPRHYQITTKDRLVEDGHLLLDLCDELDSLVEYLGQSSNDWDKEAEALANLIEYIRSPSTITELET